MEIRLTVSSCAHELCARGVNSTLGVASDKPLPYGPSLGISRPVGEFVRRT